LPALASAQLKAHDISASALQQMLLSMMLYVGDNTTDDQLR